MQRALVGFVLLAALAFPAWSAESWGYQISHELMSPFCPGRTLAACPSDKANELRSWILLQEAAGASRDDVEAQLVARYGEQILPAPPPRDLTGVAGYAIPILAIVAGAPLVFWLLRRLTASPASPLAPLSTPAPASGPVDDGLEAEVDRELRELDARSCIPAAATAARRTCSVASACPRTRCASRPMGKSTSSTPASAVPPPRASRPM